MSKKKDPVLEDLELAKKEFEENPIPEKKPNPRLKRFKVVFLAVFMVLLMVSFIYLGYPVYSYIFGLAGSSKVDSLDEAVFRDSVVVSFDEDVLSFLEELYDPFGDERAVCLLGEIRGNEYIVSDFYKPVVFDRAWNRVSHEPCGEDTIIMLHTHPFSRCAPSRADETTLRRSQVNNPDLIMLVMCGSRRFSAVI